MTTDVQPATLSAATDAPDAGTSTAREQRRHDKYWLADGSVILQTRDTAYKVHRTLLARHSPFLATLTPEAAGSTSTNTITPLVRLPDTVHSADLDALLAHLYHDSPLTEDTPFPHAAALLRASAPAQLHLPAIHARARSQLERLVPATPTPHFQPDDADAALILAVEYDIYPIQKSLYYTLAAHSDLAHDEPDDPSRPSAPSPSPSSSSSPRTTLPPALESRCKALLTQLVAHFTPILFTVGTAQHMACTDVLADAWMPAVLQPALAGSGLCRPLETLQALIELDWRALGLCDDCVRDKRAEWRGEQEVLWARMDGWLGLSPSPES